ncbi:hypothetical protein GCM10009868_21610 [Terrabacter aerolatus]|uniref:Amidase n=1 Tax=Terrabacter aerolatus TaxID=422442 RepID=A0A512D4D2_9MICO|nr:hypothetical protein [Terrabacter aerolatus]GEO31317.1 hypothetical protein TAE01_31270 [Terrabacter aerolatus]
MRLSPRSARAFTSLLALTGVTAVALALAPGAAAAAPAKPSGTTSTAPTSTTTAAAADSRALWVWDTSTPDATVDLAVSSGIDQLFVAVPPNVTTSAQLPNLRTLSERARAAGIRVDALGGDPGWVDNPSWVVTYWLKPARSTGLFTGIHIDVEPYSTSAWTTSQSTVVAGYLTLLDKLKASAGTSPIEADIPFWFNQIPAKASNGAASTLDREIMRRTSGVTVMAYRNTAAGTDGTLDIAAAELAVGTALGKPVRIGQETTYLGDTAVDTKQTFYGWTRTAMEAQLAQVDAGASSYAAYAGIAIHSAAGYAAMTP